MTDWIDEEKQRRDTGFNSPLLQSQHAEINGRYPGTTLEYCFACGAPTERAGRGDDSLYRGDKGPYCFDCYTENTVRDPGCLLVNAKAELAVALRQSCPSDDQIIMGHLQRAYEILNTLKFAPSWRPIQTAPKDGRKFLAVWEQYIYTCHWHRTRLCWAAGGPSYMTIRTEEMPTHWMPLPEPPE